MYVSSPICTKTEPDSANKSSLELGGRAGTRGTSDAKLPSVSDALICSASRTASANLPSDTSRDLVDTCQFELKRIP